MDAGNFYGARNPSCRSRGPYDYDYPSDLIPEAVTTPQRPTAGMIQVNQKLDRLLGMMGEQQKETNSVKSAMKTIREEFDSLRATVSSFSTPSSADTSVSKRPQRLPLKLSAAIKHLQEKEDTMIFLGSEAYGSEHNQKVKKHMVDRITHKYSDEFSPRKIKKAVHRYYESRRRIFNDDKPERKEKAMKSKKDSRKKGRRKKLYCARKKYLKKKKEKKLWDEIDWSYMTEESSAEEGINKHPISWRSEVLNTLIKKLEERSAKESVSSRCSFKRSERVIKSPSKCPIPLGAPKWTIQPDALVSTNEVSTPCREKSSPVRKILDSTIDDCDDKSTSLSSSSSSSDIEST